MASMDSLSHVHGMTPKYRTLLRLADENSMQPCLTQLTRHSWEVQGGKQKIRSRRQPNLCRYC